MSLNGAIHVWIFHQWSFINDIHGICPTQQGIIFYCRSSNSCRHTHPNTPVSSSAWACQEIADDKSIYWYFVTEDPWSAGLHLPNFYEEVQTNHQPITRKKKCLSNPNTCMFGFPIPHTLFCGEWGKPGEILLCDFHHKSKQIRCHIFLSLCSSVQVDYHCRYNYCIGGVREWCKFKSLKRHKCQTGPIHESESESLVCVRQVLCANLNRQNSLHPCHTTPSFIPLHKGAS